MSTHLPGLGDDDNTATFSDCRRYRYTLTRRWDNGPAVVFIGLNPSTADETKNDPTIRRCIGFAQRLGAGRLVMLNLFAFRATDPREMKAAADPIGPDNDRTIYLETGAAKAVIAAWGVHGTHLGRAAAVKAIVPHLQCLGLTQDGHPRHPLYLPATAELRPFAV